MGDDRHGRTPRTTALALGVSAAALAAVLTAVTASVAGGRGLGHALDSFVATNSVIGLAFTVCGVLVAYHRPRNPVGWLLLADGAGHAITAATVPLAEAGLRAGWADAVVRGLVTAGAYAWPWSIGLCLPLILQLFPDGRPLGRRWRALMWVTVATAPLFVVELGAEPEGVLPGVSGYLTLAGHDRLEPLWLVSELRFVVVAVLGLAALAVRYRRGGEMLRRQLLWLLLAVLVMVALTAPWALVAGTPVYVLFSIPLVPVAMTIAILRHRLLDIRLVVSRTVLYVLLTAGVVGVYLGLVVIFDRILRQEVGLGASALATVIIAVGFNPVRVRLQRHVDRVLYGDRGDPVRAVTRVGARLDAGLPGVLDAVREALRMPFAALRAGDAEVAASGTAPPVLHAIPLSYGTERVGELVVGLRPGERRLGRPDRTLLELLAAPLSAALHAVALSAELQRSREAIVVAREEERRRLRRDLHDGLGPVLTGVTFKADAAGNLLTGDPAAARALIAELRAEAAHAIDDIRRLVYDLRPPALDDLGLAGAIRQRAGQLQGVGVAVRVHAADLPALPAAIEAAAYRITVEAVTNAVRHSAAGRVDVRIDVGARLRLEITDDGGAGARWRPGVGLASMRERAAEVGGTCTAGPGPDGGRVVAVLPLGVT